MDFEDEETFKLRFQEQLQAARAKLGISQVAMADLIGCSHSMYPKYETRDHFPLYLLPKLMVETDTPSSYWIYGVPLPPERGKSRPKGGLKIVTRR